MNSETAGHPLIEGNHIPLFEGITPALAEGNHTRVDGKDDDMASNEQNTRTGIEGVVEDAKGKLKEAAGIITDDESLKGEGAAQQRKAEAQRDVVKKEAEAEKARAEADAHEAEQRLHQR